MSYMKNQKAEIREKIHEKRKNVPVEKIREMSDSICKRASALSGFRLAETVLLYAPKEIEVDVLPLAKLALSEGKKVAFPKCHRSPEGYSYMTYHLISDLSELSPGTFGILEPSEDAPVYDIKSDPHPSIAFAPALAFDKHGYRLGYGGGYYDRYFNTYNGSVIGVIFSDFIVPTLPHGRYDIKASLMITEKGVKVALED